MTLTPGTRFGSYEILAHIGAGGMGEVYSAKDTRLDREVAIKVLPVAMARDRDRLARFEREAKVLASLNHPNIAQIYGFEQSGDTRALAMELVPGSTLSVPQPLETALDFAKQIAEALEAAHEKGFTHRDLKPANIMITSEGVVKVLDFGLAAIPSRESDGDPNNSPTMTQAATQAGTIMGTAAYMSPEQATGKVVDKRSDVWSFGVVLYELLSGNRLFEGETISHTLASVLKDPIDFDLPQAPAPIRALLRRCLERNPKLRLRDIGEARVAIDAYLRNPGTEPAQVAIQTPADAQIQAQIKATARRQVSWMWMAATGVALLTAAGFAGLWLRDAGHEAPVIRFGLNRFSTADSFSPDGRWMLGHSTSGLRVRSLSENVWRNLPGTEGISDNLPVGFWSEDSKAVGFVSGDRLHTVALEGTASKDLGPAPEYGGGTWRGGAEAGTIVIATAGRLRAIDVRSRQARDLPLAFPANSPAQAHPWFPVFLPEGDSFVFGWGTFTEGYQVLRASLNSPNVKPLFRAGSQVGFARNPRAARWHAFYLSGEPEARSARNLMTVPVNPGTGELQGNPVQLLQGISRTPSGARFAVGSGGLISWQLAYSASPVFRLTWFDRTGKVLGMIGEKSNYIALALSPDETSVAVQEGFPNEHISIYNVQTGVGKRLSNLPDPQRSPYWAPDGKALYYVTNPQAAGARLIRQSMESDGTQEVVWEAPEAYVRLQELSADGRYAIFSANSGLYRLDLRAAPPRRWEELMKLQTGIGSVSLTPDGRSMVYGTTGSLYISAFPPNGQPAHRFPEVVDGSTFLSADGTTLYVANGENLFAFPLSSTSRASEGTFLFPWTHGNRVGAREGVASRDGKRILAIATDDPEALWRQVLSDWTTLLPGAK